LVNTNGHFKGIISGFSASKTRESGANAVTTGSSIILKPTNQVLIGGGGGPQGEMRENGVPVAGYRLPQIQFHNGGIPSNATAILKGLGSPTSAA